MVLFSAFGRFKDQQVMKKSLNEKYQETENTKTLLWPEKIQTTTIQLPETCVKQEHLQTFNDAITPPSDIRQNDIIERSVGSYSVSQEQLSFSELSDDNSASNTNLTNQNQLETLKSIRPLLENIIHCGFCSLSFKNLQDLRTHMPVHADGETLIDFNDCIYVKQFANSEVIDYAVLQQEIRNAYINRQISRFYQALDKYGNELDISDSDSNEEDAERALVKKNYMCVICNEAFTQRKLLLKHQQQKHMNEKSMPFTCQDCKSQYVSIHLMQQHLKKNCGNEYRRIAEQCNYCNARFIWSDNMLKHREIQQHFRTGLSHFNTVNVQYCYLCTKTFLNNDLLNDHLSQHQLKASVLKTVESIVHSTWWPNGNKIIKCKICNLRFESMNTLKVHFSSNNMSSTCSRSHSLANYTITNSKGFELHLELDSETESESDVNIKHENTATIPMPYTCNMCSKSFKRKYQIAQHQRSMHNYEMLALKCENCIFRTVSKKVLDYHKITQCFNEEKLHHCHQCNFKFMWTENLSNHISICHKPKIWKPDNLKKSNESHYDKVDIFDLHGTLEKNVKHTPSISSNLIGYKEGQVFESDILQRRETHDKDEPFNCMSENSSSLTPPTSVVKRKQYLCTICGIYLSSIKNFNSHNKLHTGDKFYKCDICGLTAGQKYTLDVHRRTHFAERPYKCKQCNKSFVAAYKLKKHMRQHTGERPFECEICKKGFANRDSLKLHMLDHTGEKPFRCDICDKTFKCKPYLRRHMIKNGHNDEDN